jgi:cyclohexa-1,5-dienecarbonyl-CoA hydratase
VIRLAIEGRLARITLARPPLNVLDLAHLADLGDAVEGARGAAVVVLAAEGRCFSAGNDVADHAPDRAPAMLAAFHRAVRGLLALDAVTVADVKGDALGGGCELVLACDLAVAAPGARFGQPEIDVGCFPPVAAALLPLRVGWGRAVEMIATGRRIDAATAERWGLVTRVAEEGALPLVAELLSKSAEVLRATKAALRAGGLDAAERVYLERLLPLGDCAEGVRAFLGKRPPRWQGARG